jgi:hypothetical protein
VFVALPFVNGKVNKKERKKEQISKTGGSPEVGGQLEV